MGAPASATGPGPAGAGGVPPTPPPPGGYEQMPGGYQQPPGYQGGGYQGAGYQGAAQPLSDSDSRMWAMLGHVGAILIGIIAPLITWLVFRERSSFVDDQGKESL